MCVMVDVWAFVRLESMSMKISFIRWKKAKKCTTIHLEIETNVTLIGSKFLSDLRKVAQHFEYYPKGWVQVVGRWNLDIWWSSGLFSTNQDTTTHNAAFVRVFWIRQRSRVVDNPSSIPFHYDGIWSGWNNWRRLDLVVESGGHLDCRVGTLTFDRRNGQKQSFGGFLKVIDSALLREGKIWGLN